MEDETKKGRNLTEFFLEWRDTCAIDKCTRKEDVRYVHDMFDRRAEGMVSGSRASSLGNGLVAVSEFSGYSGHWFHLVESEFYRQGEKTPEEGGKKYGQALKDHLFGNEGTKVSPGRLNGYFLQMLRTVINNSFTGPGVSDPVQNDDGKLVDPVDIAPDSKPDSDPPEVLAVSECLEDFRKSLLSFWTKAAIDMRLAALCFACPNKVPFSNPTVVQASGLKQSAFANRKEQAIQQLREIVSILSNDHDPDDLQFVFGKHLWNLLEELGRADPACAPFFKVS